MKKFIAILTIIFVLVLSCFAFGCGNSAVDEMKPDAEEPIYWGTVSGVISEYTISPVESVPVEGVEIKSGGQTAKTNEKGEYFIKVYSDGATLSFSKDGYFTQSKTFKSSSFNAERANYDFTMWLSTSIEGLVQDNSGARISGAVVSVGDSETATNADGYFKFEKVIASTMVICVTYNGKTTFKPVYTEQLRSGKVNITITLE